MSDDESSFVILGSTPTPSMEQYNGDVHSMTKENGSSNSMLSSTQTIKTFDTVNSLVTSQLSANKKTDSLKNDSPGNPMENKDKPLQPSIMSTSTASKADFAEQFLLGEIPADSLKYSVWKHFPSLCTPESNADDITKLEGLVSENAKLKENLQKTNDAMHQHFSTINQFQVRVKELKETQANEIAKCNQINADLQEQLRLKVLENENLHIALLERDEFNQKLKMDIARIKEEQEEKTAQFNMNLAFAAGENKDLVQDISAKNAIIQNMTKLIEQLENQAMSFDMLPSHRAQPEVQSKNDSLVMTQSLSNNVTEFATQLHAAREQNINLLEDVSNKIATIKRLESESSKLQHQLLSLEMIVNESGEKSNEDNETVQKLKDDLNRMSIENIQMRESTHQDYSKQIDELKGNLILSESRHQDAVDAIENLHMELDARNESYHELAMKFSEQQKALNELEKSSVAMRAKEIAADIEAHQKDQLCAELKEENSFLKAQLDVYKTDFEMERQARQDIANEREELLSDLKLLQRRNQQLIEESQSRSRLANGASSSTASAPPVEPNQQKPVGRFMCPVCNKVSPNLMALQSHVQICLDN